jgi:hypothetical protein
MVDKCVIYLQDLENSRFIRGISGGIRTFQASGALNRVRKTMDITLAGRRNEVTVVHRLKNKGRQAVTLAPLGALRHGQTRGGYHSTAQEGVSCQSFD